MIKKFCAFFTVLLLACTITFTGCEKKDKISSLNKEKLENIKLSKEEKENFLSVDLYFDSSKNKGKEQFAKEPRVMNKKEIIAKTVMEELINGPSTESKLDPILSRETRVLNVSVKDGVAYVNLSSEAKSKMDKQKEIICLKSIVYSLTSLDYINKVSILIENKNIDTLGGNVDISKPMGRAEVDIIK
ncbi:GerMN domain-containing protein [Clostridium sp. KNHs214]|uniref:GerMN domain-containing protein n=1 Tax=Clostridium sp. KNHs214 TaxID=1540257 RepID=UPI000555591C|nr:GerMN domain-containing protein [Clostridium sp. KNHs214]